jgi:hypothetical protein
VHPNQVATRVGNVDGVTTSTGERLAVSDTASGQPREQFVEVGAGANGEAHGVESGERRRAYASSAGRGAARCRDGGVMAELFTGIGSRYAQIDAVVRGAAHGGEPGLRELQRLIGARAWVTTLAEKGPLRAALELDVVVDTLSTTPLAASRCTCGAPVPSRARP